MSNSENYLLKALNNKTKFISQKANENITTLEKNNNKKNPNYIIDNKKKIIKTKILIPNKKCHFKKINKTLQEGTKATLSQKNIPNKKLNTLPIRKQSCGIIKRNNNYQLYESNTSTNFRIKTNINNAKRDITETSYKNLNERIKLIPKSPKNLLNKTKNNNYYIKNNYPKSYNNIGIKIIENNKNNKEYPLYITKIDQRQQILNNNINNNNFNGNITYNNNVNLNFNNNNDKNNNIIYDIPKRIYINNKEIDIIKNNIHSKSPTFRTPKLPNQLSPIEIKNINYQQGNTIQIFNKNKLIKIPIIQTEFSRDKKVFPDNFSFHEITHINSPKKKTKKKHNSINCNNDANNNYTIGSTNLYLDGLYDDKNNNLNRISNNYLLNSHKVNHFNNNMPLYDFKNLNYSNITPNNRLYAITSKNFKDGYNNNVIYPYNNQPNSNYINNDFIIPKSKRNIKIEYSDNCVDLDNEEIDDLAQSIHFFGEQMRKRNKNYNKNNNIPLEKKTKCIKIRLKKNNSYNNINHINEKINNSDKESFPTTNISYNQGKNKYEYYMTSNINNTGKNYNIEKKEQKLNRFSHNIIKRKRIKKLIMEKSQNEEFISNSNKKENKNNTIKDKISNYENSILDNDSINEIIKEFEKEIEAEEKKENNIKLNYQKRNNNISINDTLKFSFFSDNDFSIISKDSTNNSKNKMKKKHYYKTKNMDMEKDTDFVIYGNKSKSVKK